MSIRTPATLARQWVAAFTQATGTLRARPVRTALSALAAAVAIASLVLVTTALDGVSAFARQTSTRAFGADTFLLAQVASPGRVTRRELQEQLRRNPPIRRSDVRFLERYAGGRVIYAPSAQRVADVAAGSRVHENTAITGTSASLADLRDLGIVQGRFLREDETRAGAAVAVIGADVADALFAGADPLGGSIRLAGRRFEVIGVQQRLGSSGGASLDRYVWIPLISFERIFGAPLTLQVFAKATGDRPSVVAEDRARTSLRARRALAPGADDTFDLLTPEAARDFVQVLSERISVASVPIALAALLAAIVVVTNTVLVSVTERTREIGVRRAVGASRRRIAQEVVAESVITAGAGGLAGAAVTVLLVRLASQVTPVPVGVRLSVFLLSVAIAALAGLGAAWYPARRATRTDVVTALGTE